MKKEGQAMQYYVVDAFTDRVFRGNPAGVCVPDERLDEDRMQAIAAENNLSETAFLVRRDCHYDILWVTPAAEVDLCGHAPLGSAFVVSRFLEPGADRMEFHSRSSGKLLIERSGDLFTLDFPSSPPAPAGVPPLLESALGIEPDGVFLSRDFVVLLESERQVRELEPDFTQLKKLEQGLGVIVTARGEKTDFVSRCFCPKLGIDEDPVTGSAHCSLIPFWAERLQKKRMTAAQLSRRGGLLSCELCGERVKIGGKAVLYLTGEISV